MKKVFSIMLAAGALAILCGVVCLAVKTGSKKTVTIIHVNDTHSQMEPIRSGNYAGMGGVLERAAYIDSVRNADGPGNVLLLHGGDFVQGTSYYTEFSGAVESQVINALGYDAVTLGNHEFDKGLEELGELISSLEVPVVVCNYDFSPFPWGDRVKPYVIVEKAGKKIGIIGVVCNLKDMVNGDTADRLPEFETIPTVQRYADQLHRECDFVIVLSHLGFTEHHEGDITDQVLAANTRHIDMIIGGHSHTFMEEAAMIRNLRGRRIPVVQTGCQGAYMGETHIKI